VLAAERKENPALLLVDAGNACMAPERVQAGQVVVAAYEALLYDAINLSYRDFAWAAPRPWPF